VAPCPSAAGRLLDGLDELFTINRLGLPPAPRPGPGTTNIIESPQGTMQQPMRRATNWRSGDTAPRRAAASGPEAERTMRKIGGYRDPSILDAALKEEVPQKKTVTQRGRSSPPSAFHCGRDMLLAARR
jgi:putative transposase